MTILWLWSYLHLWSSWDHRCVPPRPTCWLDPFTARTREVQCPLSSLLGLKHGCFGENSPPGSQALADEGLEAPFYALVSLSLIWNYDSLICSGTLLKDQLHAGHLPPLGFPLFHSLPTQNPCPRVWLLATRAVLEEPSEATWEHRASSSLGDRPWQWSSCC